MASHSIYDTAFEESSLIDLSAFPSIYVKFFNVLAVCVTGPDQRGLAHAKATGAYDPDALSTGLFYDSLWSPLNSGSMVFRPTLKLKQKQGAPTVSP